MSKKFKNSGIVFYLILASFVALPVFSQTEAEEELLGLPGDNLDLYAVLDLFQKSKTIEDFQETLNAKETGINNLDLNLDGNVDFIKVVTKQEDEDFTFILQDDISDKETQDVAVILLSKDKEGVVTLQIVGDKDLYGKDYIIEPAPATPAVTPNPAYTGADPVTEGSAASSVVVVQSAPIVQYVYSPVYVPYYPPYYYGYYPPYYAAFTVMAVGIYRHNNYYYHSGYHGGYGNTTVVVHNHNNYNNYNNTRNSSNTVNHNNANGKYNNGNRPSNGSANKPTTRPSNPSASTRPSNPSASTRPSNPSASTRPSNPSASTRPSATTRPSNPSATTRQSSSSGGRSGGGYSGGGGGRAGSGGGASRGGRR